jgi:N-alpha-acetyltransferase 15/16, NatA auxiliary subunit
MSSAQVLPAKEQALFKTVVRLYETKALKKALKAADLILKKFPDNGETMCMKGLTINQLDRKGEAYDLVRKGLMKNMRSHICWHVYGLLYRSDHDYFEAARAYLNALRLDPDNQQILRDLALLQVQIRDYEGFEESRRKLLTVRPSQRNNWIGVAISFHLQGNYEQAIKVLQSYQDSIDSGGADDDNSDQYEASELILYKLTLLEESKDYAGALAYLTANLLRMVDRLAVRETRARLLSHLGRQNEAADELRLLISINPDNHKYYHSLLAAVTYATPAGEVLDVSLAVLDGLSAKYSRARAPGRIALALLPSGDHPQFVARLDRYVRPWLRRGVPSLFSDIKALYTVPSKIDAIFALFEAYEEALQAPQPRLPNLLPLVSLEEWDEKEERNEDEEEEESVAMVLWVRHFLAQHFDRIGLLERALTCIDAAIAHTPETVECLLSKARILKHCGDTQSAVDVADNARKLDLADRYVNTKSTKYALRNNMVTQAESWIALFTRDGDSGGVQALYDMQCMWFELEAAESHLRCGEVSLALKKFMAVERHFDDIIEDQFDFHTYCLRKVTLRAYIATLRMEDDVRSHRYYERAATGAVRCLLLLEDMSDGERQATTGGMVDISGFADLSDADRKKALSKMKKKEAKLRTQQAQEAAQAASASSTPASGKKGSKGKGKSSASSGKANGNVSAANGSVARTNADKATNGDGKSVDVVDARDSSKDDKTEKRADKVKANSTGWMEIDADGLEHVKSLLSGEKKDVTPLSEATKRIRLLELHLAGRVETHMLAFEVAMRKGKHLQALRAVRRAVSVDSAHPDVLSMIVRLTHTFQMKDATKTFSAELAAVFKTEGDMLLTNTGEMIAFVDAYVAKHAGNITRLVGAGEVMLSLALMDVSGAKSVPTAVGFIAETVAAADACGSGVSSVSALYCARLIRRLSSRQSGAPRPDIGPVIAACAAKFPRATFSVKK